MPDRGVSFHRVSGLDRGVNWRVTKFAAPVPPQLTCGLCNVVPRTSCLLPCLHTLCELCCTYSLNGKNIVCPLDGESFAEGDCSKLQFPPATADRLKACCWNEPHGCSFVGTLQAVLTHYEQECTLHSVTCPRCDGPVLQRDLPSHYRAGCRRKGTASAAGAPTLRQGGAVRAEDIRSIRIDYKASTGNPYEDLLPALESKMNEVLEEARKICAQMEAVTGAYGESERRVTQALGELVTTIGRGLRSQEALLRSHLENDSQMSEVLKQIKKNI
ncbi:TNF receptor-associated factor 6-A-like [Haemaphysalis longicornis]